MPAAADTAPRDLSASGRPYPVVPFPASWLVLFGGLNVIPTHTAPGEQPVGIEPGQGPTSPQD